MTFLKDKNGKELKFNEAILKIVDRLSNYWLDFTLMLLRWIGHFPSHSVRNLKYRIFGIKYYLKIILSVIFSPSVSLILLNIFSLFKNNSFLIIDSCEKPVISPFL